MSQDLREFTKNVLSQTDIVDIIQSRMQLKKAGANHQGLCPFHQESTPSFSVNAHKQFFYCFGCHASGDAINFIMRYDNLVFIDALTLLAKQLGLTLPERHNDQPQVDRNIYKYLREMTIHCRHDINGEAERYLSKRGITATTMRMFHLGYCGKSYLDWFDSMKKQHSRLLIAGGVASQGDKRITPKFFKRLMFPIQDSTGKIIGFGGRTLDNVPPKYLNSPETEIFKKRQVLYGLYQFRQLKKHKVIIVEGYMDCLALHSRGIEQVVACLGTAFTQQHWHLLKKYAHEMYFCFDGDRAGKQAAWKSLMAIFPALDPQIKVYFSFLPDGQDPDSLIREQGKHAFLNHIKQAMSWTDFFIENLRQTHPITDISSKANFLQHAKTAIDSMKNQALQTMLHQAINQLLSLEEQAEDSPAPQNNSNAARTNKIQQLAHHCIAMLCKKDQRPVGDYAVMDNPGHLADIDLINQWLLALQDEPTLEGNVLLGNMQGKVEYATCVGIMQTDPTAYHPTHMQIRLISLRIEIHEQWIQNVITNKKSDKHAHDQSMLQSVIMHKKQLEIKRHTLQAQALSDT